MTTHVTILGGGAIGCFLGVALASSGRRVTILARPQVVEAHDRGLLRARTLAGADNAAAALRVVSSMDELGDTDGVLITTKTKDLASIAQAWTDRGLAPSAPVWGLQNGLDSQQILATAGVRVPRAGSVTFNVVRDSGQLIQTTSGSVLLPRSPTCAVTRCICEGLRRAGVPCREVEDIGAALRGKLVLNLNNGVCASTGLTIKASVLDANARRCFQLAVQEALGVFRAAGLPVARVGRIPPRLLPRLLPLPTAILQRLAPAVIQIDPQARSSTLQDVLASRPTEVRALHGAISDVARAHGGGRAPVNDHIVRTVEGMAGSPGPVRFVSAKELLADLRRVRRAQS
jgi:2-dehydropantoate 2-reductase